MQAPNLSLVAVVSWVGDDDKHTESKDEDAVASQYPPTTMLSSALETRA